ncbi:hypothetical protein PAXINDRAFT_96950, partial [Paxillus involutus ATCC 200175]
MSRSLNNSNLTFDLTNSIVRSDDHLACHAGSFGDVYKCKYRSGSGLKEVAVKALRLIKIKLEEDKGTGGDELVNRELEIWRRLRHRNVVPFLGTATGFGQFGSVALVYLWMGHGTLQTFIDRYDGDLAIAHRFELIESAGIRCSILENVPIIGRSSGLPRRELRRRLQVQVPQRFRFEGGWNLFSVAYLPCAFLTPTEQVAVKALRLIKIKLEEDKGTGGDELVNRELEIWRRLRHRNVVPFLGTATGFGQFGSVALVYLWMGHGTLQTFIDRYDGDLAIAHRFELLVDIASGLFYLGEVEENISYLQASKQRPGEWKWTVPERLFEDSEPTPRSDIYSFGNIVLSVEQPWKNKPEAVVVLQLFQGVNPSRPQSRPIEDEHWEFIGRCWLPVQERLVAEDIVPELQRFLDTSQPHLPIREHLVVSPRDHSQPASTGTSNLQGARRDPSAPADISMQQTDNAGHSPIGNLASFMGYSSALSPSLDSDIDDCRMPQISTLTETVSLISQCPDLTQDRWMQCTSDNVTPQPLADVASDPTVEPEEGVNEDQPGVKLTGFRVFIEDIHLHDPPKIGWSPLGGSFYVKISLDGQVQKTSLTGTCRMPWTKKLI